MFIKIIIAASIIGFSLFLLILAQMIGERFKSKNKGTQNINVGCCGACSSMDSCDLPTQTEKCNSNTQDGEKTNG